MLIFNRLLLDSYTTCIFDSSVMNSLFNATFGLKIVKQKTCYKDMFQYYIVSTKCCNSFQLDCVTSSFAYVNKAWIPFLEHTSTEQ